MPEQSKEQAKAAAKAAAKESKRLQEQQAAEEKQRKKELKQQQKEGPHSAANIAPVHRMLSRAGSCSFLQAHRHTVHVD